MFNQLYVGRGGRLQFLHPKIWCIFVLTIWVQAPSAGQEVVQEAVHNKPATILNIPTDSANATLNLSQLDESLWTRAHAAHLASRASFGARRSELDALSRLSPWQSVQRFVHGLDTQHLQAFEHSDIFDSGLDPFPPSRPATTALAKRQGHALGVQVKAAGNRPLQPVVNKFFYWLRASRLETDRVAYWWADRMLTSTHPLQEKMALFWHGHFATNEDKVRDYRKMHQQLELFQTLGLGNFRELLVATARDPAMLVFLDAGVNTADSPNENFAREIMELFTMGVGHYSEKDVQEAARAFTGWNYQGLEFVVNEDTHDGGEKTILGHTANFSGEEVIDLILAQSVTAEFIAAKLYRYFVNESLDPIHHAQLGRILVDVDWNIGEYLRVLFLSEDFYTSANVGSRIKGPVEMMVAMYRDLSLTSIPGVPDLNVTAGALGQRLMHPPTVAGWSQGRSWITPSLMFERSNFALDVLFPNIGFIPPDRYPSYTAEIVNVQNRLRQGMSVSAATKPTGVDTTVGEMSASNLLADRDEDFNTRLGSMRGWQMALERVKPISRHTASVDLTEMVEAAYCNTPQDVVALFSDEFFQVSLTAVDQRELVEYFISILGTQDIGAAHSYLETPLRQLLHRMLSLPEYQLG